MRRLTLLLVPLALLACQKQTPPASQPAAVVPTGPAPGTAEWKIQDAMSAAPAAVAANATIMDWPATPTGQPTQLRAGSNGWTCFPDVPGTPHDDPMCLDQQWMTWADGWMKHQTPRVTAPGLAYMLKGGADASNTDPFAQQPDSGQDWVHSGPHVMVIVPDPKTLKGMSTDPENGGPWVMFANTPYAHVMTPVK